jgi:hypothetical protein
MAIKSKKDKFASEEVTVEAVNEVQNDQPEVESTALTEEQIALNVAINDGTLSALRDAETTSGALVTLITIYMALQGAIGDEAGATVNALANLKAFQPAKVKAAKVPKEKAFNEVKALKDAMADEHDAVAALDILVTDERISEDLKNAIITYTTLLHIDGIPQAITDGAWETLGNFGRKGKSGTRVASGPRVAFGIEVDGVVYGALTAAIKAQGITKEITGDNKSDDADIAWRTIRPKLLKDGVAEYNGVTYTKTDAPVTAVAEPEAPAEEEPTQ